MHVSVADQTSFPVVTPDDGDSRNPTIPSKLLFCKVLLCI